MPTNINTVLCKKYQRGTGLVDCEPFFKQPKSFLLVRKGWFIDLTTTTFDLQYVINAIQDGTFVPMLNTKQFTENTGDPVRQDYQGGGRRTVRQASPDYRFEFDNGTSFHSNVYSYNNGNFDLLIIDTLGTVMGQRNIAGTRMTGFTIEDLSVATYRQANGDESASTMVDIYLGDTEAFNRQMALIDVNEIGANLNKEIAGVVSVNITILSADVSDGTVVVQVNAANNKGFGIEALDINNFDFLNVTANAYISLTEVTPDTNVPGKYTLTPIAMPAAGTNVKVQTKQYSLGQAARISATELLYMGESAVKIVTA